jgi:hypothetical protein
MPLKPPTVEQLRCATQHQVAATPGSSLSQPFTGTSASPTSPLVGHQQQQQPPMTGCSCAQPQPWYATSSLLRPGSTSPFNAAQPSPPPRPPGPPPPYRPPLETRASPLQPPQQQQPPMSHLHCTSILCKASFEVCDYCHAYVVDIHDESLDINHGTKYLSVLARSLGHLIQMLNNLPAMKLPVWTAVSSGFSDASLRVQGRDADRSEDHDNLSASAMVLAMLKPLVFGIPAFGPLRIFGVPPPDNLLLVSDASPQSGRGQDNRRGNLVEALNVHFRTTGQTDVHSQLQETWMLFRTQCELILRKEMLYRPTAAWFPFTLKHFFMGHSTSRNMT